MLVDRHFFFRAIQEINKELIKNIKEFLIDITTALHKFFDQEALVYWELKGYYNVQENIQCLELLIKEHTNDEELIPYLKKIRNQFTCIMCKCNCVFS